MYVLHIKKEGWEKEWTRAGGTAGKDEKRGGKTEKLICNYNKIVYNKDIAAAVKMAAGSHNNQGASESIRQAERIGAS